MTSVKPASIALCLGMDYAGIREYAKEHGAGIVPLTDQETEAWLAAPDGMVREGGAKLARS